MRERKCPADAARGFMTALTLVPAASCIFNGQIIDKQRSKI